MSRPVLHCMLGAHDFTVYSDLRMVCKTCGHRISYQHVTSWEASKVTERARIIAAYEAGKRVKPSGVQPPPIDLSGQGREKQPDKDLQRTSEAVDVGIAAVVFTGVAVATFAFFALLRQWFG